MRPFLLLLALASLAPAAPTLDAKKIESFGMEWFKARPKTLFDRWDPAARADLLREAATFGALPEGSLGTVRDLLWKAVRKHGPKGRNASGKNTIETPYGEMWAYVQGGGGKKKGLVVGLHGGGEGAGSADEPRGTWQLKGCMGVYPQGLVLTGDNWNTVHGEKHILTLIETAKAQHDIDPDRVYVMGFSMGGTGSWHMAGRFPDLFAGAAPCAGVVMASPKSAVPTKEEVLTVQYGIVPNVRNLAMYYFIGLEDRNCPPGTYLFVQDMLADLKKEDPGGYGGIRFTTYPGLAHAMPPGEPGKLLEWIGEQRRDAFPKKIVWEYALHPHPLPQAHDKTDRLVQNWFYWIRHDRPSDRMEIKAERNGNAFSIRALGVDREGLWLMLNPSMIDVSEEIVVTVDGEEFYRGKPVPDLATVVESLDSKLDTTLVFDRKVPLWK